ncbi:hypothetical protein KAR91_24580 [Candidatus Pacearchaeota archaeon]|nr:hypothetical protein [Candidatus Pacearchaeota archaeon]
MSLLKERADKEMNPLKEIHEAIGRCLALEWQVKELIEAVDLLTTILSEAERKAMDPLSSPLHIARRIIAKWNFIVGEKTE